MIPVTAFAGRRVGVLGLARSGRAAARALAAGGAQVLAWDDDPAIRAACGELPQGDLARADWRDIAALVLSPGIPHSFPAPHPVVALARAGGAEMIGDIELLARTCRAARYVCVTGTNGKSTTTALIGHILREAGERVEIGGNLGTAALALAPLAGGETYVLELSSYQLELVPSLSADIAVLLNLTPDHLDRHGGMAGYVAAKRRIFANAPPGATAVVGIDDPFCREIAEALGRAGARRVVPISAVGAAPGGVYVEAGFLVDALGEAPVPVLDLARAPRLPGAHNGQNAAAAYAAARAAGIPADTAIAAIRSFPGLAHRQELVETIDRIRYINDSKATNADAAEKALACYDAVYWIGGGLPKAGGIAALEPYFTRMRHAFLIGRAADEFAATLAGKVAVTRCGDLATAVAAAAARAAAERVAGAVVLLSPACASFDQFADFEARGDAFRGLVAALPGERQGLGGPQT